MCLAGVDIEAQKSYKDYLDLVRIILVVPNVWISCVSMFYMSSLVYENHERNTVDHLEKSAGLRLNSSERQNGFRKEWKKKKRYKRIYPLPIFRRGTLA